MPSTDYIDELLAEAFDTSLPDGWTGWVDGSRLHMRSDTKRKTRPWCRGRPRTGRVEWFPRTAKRPREGSRWAVYSAADQFAGLSKPGWFILNAYVHVDQALDPNGERLGTISEDVLDELYVKLSRLFWDQR